MNKDITYSVIQSPGIVGVGLPSLEGSFVYLMKDHGGCNSMWHRESKEWFRATRLVGETDILTTKSLTEAVAFIIQHSIDRGIDLVYLSSWMELI